MGHAVFHVKNIDDLLGFYRDVLGFGVSDYILTPFRAYFLHVNPRHHTVALIETGKQDLHHLMVELYSLDDVGQGYDIALGEPERIATTLGRHPNDCVTSYYLKSPSGFMLEYGWGGHGTFGGPAGGAHTLTSGGGGGGFALGETGRRAPAATPVAVGRTPAWVPVPTTGLGVRAATAAAAAALAAALAAAAVRPAVEHSVRAVASAPAGASVAGVAVKAEGAGASAAAAELGPMAASAAAPGATQPGQARGRRYDE